MSAVMLCFPQKSRSSWVSAIPPISEPAIDLRPINSGVVFNVGSRSPGNPTSTKVPLTDNNGMYELSSCV